MAKKSASKPKKEKVAKPIEKEEVVEKEEVFNQKVDKKSLFAKIWNFTMWTILLLWMGICTTDFIRTQQDKRPVFTFMNEVIEHEDGKVYSYTGLGYRIFFYERASYNAVRFGPFWMNEHIPEATE